MDRAHPLTFIFAVQESFEFTFCDRLRVHQLGEVFCASSRLDGSTTATRGRPSYDRHQTAILVAKPRHTENSMDWTTALIVQVVAGFAGAHFAATALHDHSFGWLGHSLVGLIAGALSGYALQTIMLTVVTGSGSTNELRRWA